MLLVVLLSFSFVPNPPASQMIPRRFFCHTRPLVALVVETSWFFFQLRDFSPTLRLGASLSKCSFLGLFFKGGVVLTFDPLRDLLLKRVSTETKIFSPVALFDFCLGVLFN